jgi:hypothetical protein
MAIPGTDITGGLCSSTTSRGCPAGGGQVVNQGGGPTGSQGSSATGSSSPAPAPDKGKEEQVRVVLDDDEVSFDEDESLWLRL